MNATDTPHAVESVLEWRGTWLAARLAIVAIYLVSALGHVAGFQAAVTEQAHFGMPAPAFMAGLTVTLELVGSLLILSGRWVWLGTGMLGSFTALGAIIAHPFWTLQGSARFEVMATFLEHLGLIGGLVLIALVAERAARREESNVR
ncbi:DoxX family protein [Sphingomonas sp. MS122]|uniref:DoxX family protein n=1 Tax=Sphingomonas sp. MS122 TaxID=3412683 RepID=UPI003C30B5E6